MEEIFINTFIDEIQYYLDSDKVLAHPNIEELNKFRSFFPLFSYSYYQEHIPNLQIGESEFKLGQKIPFSKDKTSFIIPLANQIRVELRKKRKLNSKYSNLENILNKNKFTLNKIVDIEFFEYYQSQFRLVKDLNKSRIDFQNKSSLNNILWALKVENEKNFEQILSLDNSIEDGILVLYELLEDKKIDSKIFTGFLDTEKIHLQIANINKSSQQRNILIYYGYGNYYPFTRNIIDKKEYENRLNRFDLINANEHEILKYVQNKFNQEQEKIDKNLLVLINSSQREYSSHFNRYFSYENRLNKFKGNKKPLGGTDFFFSLNPRIRTKSAALIAYNMFKHKLISLS
ncbi:MAG: hypothetical protein ACMXYB_03835 [Candidatus Woesearchaeota archaeon]